MPITYLIDQSRGRIITTCAGHVTLREVMAHFDELQRDPERPDTFSTRPTSETASISLPGC